MDALPWHHLHITLEEREAAAIWHDANTPAERRERTQRSENLWSGANLLQIQSEAVARAPRTARIAALGIGVADLADAIEAWERAGGRTSQRAEKSAHVRDPWGTPIELVESKRLGYTHVDIEADEPEALRAWYEAHLGGAARPCAWDAERFALGLDSISLVFRERRADAPATTDRVIDHLGWYTRDLDATVASLAAAGGHVPVAPHEVGPVRLAFGEDPCGLWFELLEPPGGTIYKPE